MKGFDGWLPSEPPADGSAFFGIDRTIALPRLDRNKRHPHHLLHVRARTWLGRRVYALAYWLLRGDL